MGKFIKISLHDFLTEQQTLNGNIIDKYDVVKTIKTEYNGFNGIGVVEKVDDEYVYVSTIPSWINYLNYDIKWERKNTIKLKLDNVIKVTNDNLKDLSYDSQEKYKTYIHLLKKYLTD
jgi:hypothetical protein